jgi:prepilin-type N-terminal cleavage/methylation domain-containing protein
MNRGFSMVEVIISMGLLSGLAVMGMQFMKNQSEAQKTVEKKYETVTVLSSIRTLLSEPDNCTETFRGRPPNTFVPTKLQKKVSSGFDEVYEIGTQLPGNIKIKDYLWNKAYPGLASNEAVLRINFDLGKEAIRDHSQSILKINFTLDPLTGLILSCYALNNNSDNLWEKSFLDPHNIFYNSGNVGIGTTNPTARLTVNGSIKIGQGGLCNSMTEGELRYDVASHTMSYCNGTGWATLNGQLVASPAVELNGDPSSVAITVSPCPSGLVVRSCGLRLTTNTLDPDGTSCTIDPVNNTCVGSRNQVGASDPGIYLDCFCI